MFQHTTFFERLFDNKVVETLFSYLYVRLFFIFIQYFILSFACSLNMSLVFLFVWFYFAVVDDLTWVSLRFFNLSLVPVINLVKYLTVLLQIFFLSFLFICFIVHKLFVIECSVLFLLIHISLLGGLYWSIFKFIDSFLSCEKAINKPVPDICPL